MTSWSHKGPNSIARYMVGVELSNPLLPEVLKEIAALHPTIRDTLPRKVEQQAMTFQVGQPQPTVASLGGVIFDLIERDGTISQQMAITPNLIFFMISEYSRYEKFWNLAERLMTPVLQIAFKKSGIAAIVLEANNRFYWHGPETDIDCSALLQKDCRFIAPNVTTQRNLSHSFHGFVTPSIDPPGRRVDNINFALLERSENHNPVDLILNYRVIFNNPIFSPESAAPDELVSKMGLKFKDLHDANNIRFTETVVPEIWEKMEGLTK